MNHYYQTAADLLTKNGYSVKKVIAIPSTEILGLEVYVSPLRGQIEVDNIRGLLGDGWEVDKGRENDCITIEMAQISTISENEYQIKGKKIGDF